MDMEIDQNDHQKNTMNSNTSEANPRDWEDFWYAPEKFGSWSYEEFEKIWWEMEAIEPLTP